MVDTSILVARRTCWRTAVNLILSSALLAVAIPRAEAQCSGFIQGPIRIETNPNPDLRQRCDLNYEISSASEGSNFAAYATVYDDLCDLGGSFGPFLIFYSYNGILIADPLHWHTLGNTGSTQKLPYPCTIYSDGPWAVDIDAQCVGSHYEALGTITCGGGIFRVGTDHCGDGTVGNDWVISEECDDGNRVEGYVDGCSSQCYVWPGWRCAGQPSNCSLLPCSDGVKDPGEACDDGNSIRGDGCSSLCAIEPGYTCTGSPSVCTTLCGNGVVNPGEQCDDSGRKDGDGCSYFCQLEPETKSGPAGFFKVTTDQDNDGLATASDPVETMVWTGPSLTGTVTITESGAPAAPIGYSALGVNVAITAPVATPDAPMVFQFVYDVTLYPASLNVNNIVIKRNGVTVPNCSGVGATPDPCVESRIRLLPSNDVQIRVRTSKASDWGASVPLCGVFAADPKPQLLMTDTKLRIKGVFPLPSGASFADLAPQLKGAHVLVEGAGDGIGADATLPAGDYTGRGTRGWSSNATGTMWMYRDRTDTPLDGIIKFSIKDLGDGAVRVKVVGKGGAYDIAAAAGPLHAVVDLGDASDAAAGLCGQSNAAQ